jgi:hypothetical protein
MGKAMVLGSMVCNELVTKLDSRTRRRDTYFGSHARVSGARQFLRNVSSFLHNKHFEPRRFTHSLNHSENLISDHKYLIYPYNIYMKFPTDTK